MAFAKTGAPAPDFELLDQDENAVRLSDFRGKVVVIYFYPKAMTPGCTSPACGLRDSRAELDRLGVVALGLSPDKPARLKKFEARDKLNFRLLSDPDHAVADQYGAWGRKKFMGREYDGILRTTFIIDKSGNLAEVMDKVNTKTHHDDVLQWITANLT
jgi:thioredoxin-dependent peroxiredoxin